MELNNFGGVMAFAITLESDLLKLIEKIITKNSFATLLEQLELLSKDCTKNIKFIERTRRENVNEMILEPMSGLNQDQYQIDFINLDHLTPDKLKNILETTLKFYKDAHQQIPNFEAKSLFKRLIQQRTSTLKNLNEV